MRKSVRILWEDGEISGENGIQEVPGSTPGGSTTILPSFSPILPPLCTHPLHARKNPKIQGITKVGGL